METKPRFPWYRERLQTKYGKAPTSTLLAVSGRRDLVNPSFSDSTERSSVFLKEQRGAAALFSPSPRKSIPKEYACFSKQMIQKQTGREYVSSLEAKLKQHPLVTFPHYKEHMSPEVFDQVLSILDPDMCVNNNDTPSRDHTEKNEVEKCAKLQNESSSDGLNQSHTNIYIIQMEALKKRQEARVNQQNAHKTRRKPHGLIRK